MGDNLVPNGLQGFLLQVEISEIMCNLAGRSSGGIRREDASNDGSFVFDDFEFTEFAGHRSISAGAPACMSAIAYHAGHAAADLLRSILALHLPDEAANSDQD